MALAEKLQIYIREWWWRRWRWEGNYWGACHAAATSPVLSVALDPRTWISVGLLSRCLIVFFRMCCPHAALR